MCELAGGSVDTRSHDTTAAITAQTTRNAIAGALMAQHPAWGGSSHGWVPVEIHSTPVPILVERLWVAHHEHTSVTTQRAQMTTRSGHCPNTCFFLVVGDGNDCSSFVCCFCCFCFFSFFFCFSLFTFEFFSAPLCASPFAPPFTFWRSQFLKSIRICFKFSGIQK